MAKAQFTGVNLQVGQERVLNLTLSPSSVSTEVTVSGGELTQVDTSSAAIGANVNAREVATLPLNGRQLSQLYLLAPGAQTAGGGSFDNIRFSGRANQENAVRFDGVEASSIIDASPGNLNGEDLDGIPPAEQPGDRGRVPRGFEQLSGRVRHRHRRPDQRGQQVRRQRLPRRPLRVSSQQRAGCPQFLRRRHQDAAAVEPIRRLDRRSDQEGQVVLLRGAGDPCGNAPA